jgi:hypothetical protein
MIKKLTIKFIKSEFAKEKYILLDKECKNSKQKLSYICPKGHRYSISWNHWQQGKRCPRCAWNAKKDTEFVKLEFAKENYQLLTKKYGSSQQKLNYICPKGHKHNISWSNWYQGQRCPHYARNIKKTIEFIRSELAREDYKLLTKKYINNTQKLEYVCPEGHRHSISWHNWCQGKRCPHRAGLVKKTIEFIRSEFTKKGYKLLTTEYINCDQKLKYICPKGHSHSVSWSNWRRGQRCPYRTGIISKGEIEVRNFIKSLEIKVFSNNRSQIFNPETGNGLELDIFMPDLNKAVEYNGEYWHKDKINNDLLKQKLCELKGIDLLTIWDKEWKINNEKCKNKITKFLFTSLAFSKGGINN